MISSLPKVQPICGSHSDGDPLLVTLIVEMTPDWVETVKTLELFSNRLCSTVVIILIENQNHKI